MLEAVRHCGSFLTKHRRVRAMPVSVAWPNAEAPPVLRSSIRMNRLHEGRCVEGIGTQPIFSRSGPRLTRPCVLTVLLKTTQHMAESNLSSFIRSVADLLRGDDKQSDYGKVILPHAPEAWIDHEKIKIGYEIPFYRHCYVFKPPRELSEIDAELNVVTDRNLTMIGGLSK